MILTGRAYEQLQRFSKALELYGQVLPLLREMGDLQDEASVLNRVGLVYDGLGERAKALEYYELGLPIRRAVGDRKGEAATLNNIGSLYGALGEWGKALEYYDLALPICRAVGESKGEAATLNNIAVAYDALGDREKALMYYKLALPIRRAVGDRKGEARTLNNIGLVYDNLGDRARALDFLSQALPIRRATGDRDGEGTSLNNIGAFFNDSGESPKALEFFQRALPIIRAVGDRSAESATLSNVGLAYDALGARPAAILFAKQGINLLQTLRSDVRTLDRSLQRTYADSVSDRYRCLADWLAAEGRIPEARTVLDLLKDDEYAQFLRRDAGTGAIDLTPVERTWLAEYTRLSEPIGKLGEEGSRIEGLDLGVRTAVQTARLIAIDAEIAQASGDIDAFALGLKKSTGKAATGENRPRNGEASRTLSTTLAKLPGTAAVYTLVTADHVRTMLCLPGAKAVGQAPAKVASAELGKKIVAFRNALEDPTKDPRPLGAELYDLLIRPFEPALKKGKIETLLWSLDSVLRYVPLWALYDRNTNRYLVQKYPSALFTPRTVDRLAEPVAPATSARGFGVTEASSVPGLDGKAIAFPALPGVDAEMAALTEAFGSKATTNGAFTEAALMAGLEGKPGILHVATHFRFKPGSDADSFLLLGSNGKLTLEAFKGLPDDCLKGVDLLVLSACETAVGSAGADGSEFEGFSLLAQYKGAGAVMATLWPVSDDATAALMRSFYRLKKANSGWTKLRCLTEAQLSLITDGGRSKPKGLRRAGKAGGGVPQWPEGQPRFSHPFYWAPFVLTGNSR